MRRKAAICVDSDTILTEMAIYDEAKLCYNRKKQSPASILTGALLHLNGAHKRPPFFAALRSLEELHGTRIV